MSKIFSPSIICVNALPPTAVWMTFCTSADADAPVLALLAIDAEFQVRLALDVEDAHVLDALDAVPGSFFISSASRSSSSRSGPKIFTELSPLTPESDSMTLSRMFCEKFQSTPSSFREARRSCR